MAAMTLVVRMLPSIGSKRGEEICWERANIRLTTWLQLALIFSQVKSKRGYSLKECGDLNALLVMSFRMVGSRQPFEEGIHLSDDFRRIRPKNIVIGVWHPNNMSGRYSGCERVRLRGTAR